MVPHITTYARHVTKGRSSASVKNASKLDKFGRAATLEQYALRLRGVLTEVKAKPTKATRSDHAGMRTPLIYIGITRRRQK